MLGERDGASGGAVAEDARRARRRTRSSRKPRKSSTPRPSARPPKSSTRASRRSGGRSARRCSRRAGRPLAYREAVKQYFLSQHAKEDVSNRRPAGRGRRAVRFLALSPAAAYALLAGVALVILLLHLLKPPPPRRRHPVRAAVGAVARSRKRPPARRLMSLLLALGSRTQPGAGPDPAGNRRDRRERLNALALMLDNSPSMAARTRDGRTPLGACDRAGARAAGQRSSAATEVTLLDTVGRLGVSGFVERDAAIAALARVPAAAWGQRAHAAGRRSSPARKCTCSPMALHRSTAPAARHRALGVRSGGQRRGDRLRSPSAGPGSDPLRSAGAGAERFARRSARAGADHGRRATSPSPRISTCARARPSTRPSTSPTSKAACSARRWCARPDAFALDDLAYAVIPPHRPKRVLLVTAGNPQLEDALRHLPGVRLAVVTPERYPRSGQARRLGVRPVRSGRAAGGRRAAAAAACAQLAGGAVHRADRRRASPTGTRTTPSRVGSRGAT